MFLFIFLFFFFHFQTRAGEFCIFIVLSVAVLQRLKMRTIEDVAEGHSALSDHFPCGQPYSGVSKASWPAVQKD